MIKNDDFSSHRNNSIREFEAKGVSPMTVENTNTDINKAISDLDVIQDKVFIGVGSAVAYQLNILNHETSKVKTSIGRSYEGHITIIGRQDPWDTSNDKGRGQGYINHQKEIIGNWGKTVPVYDKAYADREEFSKSNKDQIRKAEEMGARLIDDEVIGIKKSEEKGGGFVISLKKGGEIHTKQVVVAMGAGPHTKVGVTKNPTKEEAKLDNIKIDESVKGTDLENIMDLDTFMRRFPPGSDGLKNKTVVVHGPNAGIDAVERAGYLKSKDVKWVIRNTAPVLLSGHQLEYAPEVAQKTIPVHDLTIKKNTKGGPPLAFDASTTTKTKTKEGKDVLEKKDVIVPDADFYVYALGQDPDKEGSVGWLLKGGEQGRDVAEKSSASLVLGELEPVYDINQIYGQPYETVLGLQTKGSNSEKGLMLIGASVVPALVSQVKHNYLEKTWEGLRDDLKSFLSEDALPKEVTKLTAEKIKELSTDLKQELEKEQIRKEQELSKKLDASLSAIHKSAINISKLTALQFQLKHLDIANAYFAMKETDKSINLELNNQTSSQVASVIQPAQQGAIKAAIAAYSGYIPPYVLNGEVNFTTDDETILRVFIAYNYPSISEKNAHTFIAQVLELRTKFPGTEGKEPSLNTQPVWGAPDHVRAGYYEELGKMNEDKSREPKLPQYWTSEWETEWKAWGKESNLAVQSLTNKIWTDVISNIDGPDS